MYKMILAVIVVIVIVAGGFIVLASNENDTTNANNTTSQEANTQELDQTATQEQNESTVQENMSESYTIQEVAMHATESDCWTYIGTNVYDITSYIPRHPGGDEILLACGADGKSLFENRTTQDGETIGSGTPHSSRATGQLADLLIGSLIE